jgi:hypothetical protein
MDLADSLAHLYYSLMFFCFCSENSPAHQLLQIAIKLYAVRRVS